MENNNLKIFALDLSVADTFYVFKGNSPVPVKREDVRERLKICRRVDGTPYVDQFVDTPVGTFDACDFFYRERGSLLKAAPFRDVTFRSKFRVSYPGRDPVVRNLTRRPDGSMATSFTYCSVNRFGIARVCDDLWTEEVFTRCSGDDVPAVWECCNPTCRNVFNDEREASFHCNAFGERTFASYLSIGSKAEREIRDAVKALKDALDRNGVRMVLDEADLNAVKFIANVNVPGLKVSQTEGREDETWFDIPRNMYRDFGMGSLDIRYVGFGEYLVKEQPTDNKRDN